MTDPTIQDWIIPDAFVILEINPEGTPIRGYGMAGGITEADVIVERLSVKHPERTFRVFGAHRIAAAEPMTDAERIAEIQQASVRIEEAQRDIERSREETGVQPGEPLLGPRGDGDD